MTFTYTPNSPNDITRVRFHIADTVESSAMYSDEEITFGIAEGGSYQQAVIILLQNLIARLSAEPDFYGGLAAGGQPAQCGGVPGVIAGEAAAVRD
jgi:hypothetical protein